MLSRKTGKTIWKQVSLKSETPLWQPVYELYVKAFTSHFWLGADCLCWVACARMAHTGGTWCASTGAGTVCRKGGRALGPALSDSGVHV